MQSRLPQSRIRNELFVTLTKDLYSLLGKICCFKITIQKYKNAGEGKMAKTMKLQAKLMFPCTSCDQWQNPTFCLTSYGHGGVADTFVGNYKRILEEKPKWKVGVEICFRFFISRPSEKWWVGASDRIDQVPRCPNIFFISVKKSDDECEKDTKQFQVMNINKWMGQILVLHVLSKAIDFLGKIQYPPATHFPHISCSLHLFINSWNYMDFL